MSAPYTLHGIWASGPSYKVGLALALTGQKFDYEHVDLRSGAGQKPEFKAKSRWGQVPCLTVNASGKHLTQSAAILGYIAMTTGKLAGANDDDKQSIREWMLWSADRLGPPIYRCRANALGFRKFDPATIEMYSADGKAALKALDEHLGKHLWVVGTTASVADVDAYGVVAYAPDGGFTLADTPNIQAWMARVEALPGFGKPDSLLPKESRKG